MARTDLITRIIFQDRSMVFVEPDKDDTFAEFAEYVRKQFNIDPAVDLYPNPIRKNFRNKKIREIQEKGVLDINLIPKFENIEEPANGTTEGTDNEQKSFLSESTDEDPNSIIEAQKKSRSK